MAFEMHIYKGTGCITEKSKSGYPIGEKHAILLFLKEDENSDYNLIKAEETAFKTGLDQVEFSKSGKVSPDKIAGNTNEDAYNSAVELGSALILYSDPITD